MNNVYIFQRSYNSYDAEGIAIVALNEERARELLQKQFPGQTVNLERLGNNHYNKAYFDLEMTIPTDKEAVIDDENWLLSWSWD